MPRAFRASMSLALRVCEFTSYPIKIAKGVSRSELCRTISEFPLCLTVLNINSWAMVRAAFEGFLVHEP